MRLCFRTEEMTFKIHGCWYWRISTDHKWLPISVSLQLCHYFATLPRHYHFYVQRIIGYVTACDLDKSFNIDLTCNDVTYAFWFLSSFIPYFLKHVLRKILSIWRGFQGHWRSLIFALFDRPHTICHYCFYCFITDPDRAPSGGLFVVLGQPRRSISRITRNYLTITIYLTRWSTLSCLTGVSAVSALNNWQ